MWLFLMICEIPAVSETVCKNWAFPDYCDVFTIIPSMSEKAQGSAQVLAAVDLQELPNPAIGIEHI